jgi:hypothetical protein
MRRRTLKVITWSSGGVTGPISGSGLRSPAGVVGRMCIAHGTQMPVCGRKALRPVVRERARQAEPSPPLSRPWKDAAASLMPSSATVVPRCSYFVTMASSAATVEASQTCVRDRSITT